MKAKIGSCAAWLLVLSGAAFGEQLYKSPYHFPASTQPSRATKPPLVIADFEYPDNAAFQKEWVHYKEGDPEQHVLEYDTKAPGGGRAACRFSYSTNFGTSLTTGFHSVNKVWDWRGYNTLRFWLMPDGTHRGFFLRFRLKKRPDYLFQVFNPMSPTDRAPRWVEIGLTDIQRRLGDPYTGVFKADTVDWFMIGVWGNVGNNAVVIDDITLIDKPENGDVTNDSVDLANPRPVALPYGQPVRINCGSFFPYKDSTGRDWVPDVGYVAGTVTHRPSGFTFSNAEVPEVHRYERWGVLAYLFQLANGPYNLRMHFADAYYQEPGHRDFTITANGQTVVSHFDIFAASGGFCKAIVKTLPITVTNNTLDIRFTDGIGKVDGIEILPVTTAPAVKPAPPGPTPRR